MLREEREVVKSELCRVFHRAGALKFGAFRLTSGKKSPYYINLRVVPSFPQIFKRVCDSYLEYIKRELDANEFDRVAGIPTAGIPFAVTIAYRLKKPFLYIRPRVRLRGRERRIEGIILPGDHVLLIDDLIATGNSLRRSALAIRAEGGVVADAFVLLDREEGGRKKLAKEKISLHYLLRMSEVADRLFEMEVLTDDQLKIIRKQIKTNSSNIKLQHKELLTP